MSSGDDGMFDARHGPDLVGRWTKCPRCGRRGVIDDVLRGAIVIRHAADVWHVISKEEANGILWEWDR